MLTVAQLDAKIAALTRDVENFQRQAESYALEIASGQGSTGFVPSGWAEKNFDIADRQRADKAEALRRLQMARAAAQRNENGETQE